MGFRIAYKNLVKSHKLMTVFRPYNRKYAELYPVGRCINGRIIAIPGNTKTNTPPTYDSCVENIKITSNRIVRIGDLKKYDFRNSSPDIHDRETLKWHLALVYNKLIESFNKNTKIILIELRYEK